MATVPAETTTVSPGHGVQAWYTHCPVYHAGNVDALAIEKDSMAEEGFIQNDCDVRERAAPEFMEQALTSLAN